MKKCDCSCSKRNVLGKCSVDWAYISKTPEYQRMKDACKKIRKANKRRSKMKVPVSCLCNFKDENGRCGITRICKTYKEDQKMENQP